MSDTIVTCMVKENAELIARILDYDIEHEKFDHCGVWKEWWPGDCAVILTGEEVLYECSVCESKHIAKSNYCPNCGADMREVNTDEQQ